MPIKCCGNCGKLLKSADWVGLCQVCFNTKALRVQTPSWFGLTCLGLGVGAAINSVWATLEALPYTNLDLEADLRLVMLEYYGHLWQGQALSELWPSGEC